ncbi:MAG: DUF4292 domain-containing protein [Bacteroidales bacterium]|nr:DUF4292 domain-containing protein [Bacteroidales bacterium]
MRFFIIILLFFTITSCGIFKKTTSYSQLNVDSLVLKQTSYNTISYKFLLKYSSSNQNINLFGNFLNFYDSVLIFDVSPGFGIKVANVFISPDTTIVYLPLQQEAYVGGADLFLNKYNIALNFYSLQSLFTANLFSYPYFIDINNYSIDKDSSLLLSNKIYNKRNNSITDILHFFRYDRNNNLSRVFIADYVLNKQINLFYSDFTIIDSVYNFPTRANVKLYDHDTTSFDFIFKNIKFNNNQTFEFILPANVKITNL